MSAPFRFLARHAVILALALCTKAGLAHGTSDHTHDLWLAWNLDPGLVIPLSIAAGVYALGLLRLWRRAGVGRGISRRAALAFATGMLVLVIALLSPLDALTSALFSVHMVQHLLLILVAPPLLVVGAPDIALLWALPARWRSGWGRFERRLGRWFTGDGGGKGPLMLALLATGVLWAWHLPQLYDLAVRNELVHWAEHAAFLVTALLFWASILRLRPRDHVGNGLRILYVFGMALQGSLLGALITFASRPLYTSHIESAGDWGLSALVDQQIAGLIMWVPPAALYIGVSSYLFVQWLNVVAARNTKETSRHVRQAAEPSIPQPPSTNCGRSPS